MVFFINIYGRATDPPDKANQIVGDNDIAKNRYGILFGHLIEANIG